jgi:hypothetical protein
MPESTHLTTNSLAPAILQRLLPDQAAIESFFTAADVTFASGLLAMLQAVAPPSIAQLKTQHSNFNRGVFSGQIDVCTCRY